MPPKAGQKAAAKQGKLGSLPKDVVPAGIKQPPRDPRPTRPVEPSAVESPLRGIMESLKQVEEWPGDEAARNFDFSVPLTGQQNFSLPNSFGKNSTYVIFWRRPIEFILEQLKANRYLHPLNFKGVPNSSLAIFKNIKPTDLKIKPSTLRRNSQKTRTMVEIREDDEREEEEVLSPDHFLVKMYINEEELEVNMMKELRICEMFERDETPEEAEQRKKEEATGKGPNTKNTKKAVPPPKKGGTAVEEEVPGNKIKDCHLSNIDMSGYYPPFSKWIAGCLQVIKEKEILDSKTKKPIWSRIYPQKDGIPQFSSSGRYWVKLNFQGKERKVEIDDRMPVNYSNLPLFPKSENIFDLWPLIISKALYKLFSFKWVEDPNAKNFDVEAGDGSIMYALTGLVPETIRVAPQNYESTKCLFLQSPPLFSLGLLFVFFEICDQLPSFKLLWTQQPCGRSSISIWMTKAGARAKPS